MDLVYKIPVLPVLFPDLASFDHKPTVAKTLRQTAGLAGSLHTAAGDVTQKPPHDVTVLQHGAAGR